MQGKCPLISLIIYLETSQRRTEDTSIPLTSGISTPYIPRIMTSFEEATAVTQLTPHTYAAHFPEDWCIGSGSLDMPHTRKNSTANASPQFLMAGS